MAFLIKVKVFNKVKGQFGTANQPKGPRWIINIVYIAASDKFTSCSSLRLNRKVNFSKVKVILCHMTVLGAMSKFN